MASGLFDEFIDPKKLPKSDQTEGTASLNPTPEETRAKLNVIPQNVPKDASGLFDEFVRPQGESAMESTGLFDEFKTGTAPKSTGLFDDLIEKDATGTPKKVFTDMKELAKAVAVSGFTSPKVIGKLASLDSNLYGDIDPIKIKITDFLPTPTRIATTSGKLFAREESAVAELALDRLRGNQQLIPALLGGAGPIALSQEKGFKEGVAGERNSQFGEGLSQIGDIAREFNVPEPLAALFGIVGQAYLPTSVLLGKIAPVTRMFSKGEDLAKNGVARDLLISQFKDSKASLDEVKKGILAQIGEDLPPETFQRFQQEVLDAPDRKKAFSLFNRIEQTKSEKALSEKVLSKDYKDPVRNVKSMYQDTISAPRVLDMLDGFQNYGGINARLGKTLTVAETKANYNSRRMTHDFLEEVQDLGFDVIPEDLEFKLAVNSYARQGEDSAVKSLLASKGLKEIPKLDQKESAILDIAEKYLNENVDALAEVYTKTTNRPFLKVKNYSAPLRYADEPSVNVAELVNRNYRYNPTKDLATKFTEREVNKRIPRSDFLNLVTTAIHDQEWFTNVQSRVHSIRNTLAHPTYLKGADKDTLKYWSEYLSAVQNRGNNAIPSGAQGAIKQARMNLNSAVLGYRLGSILMQPFAVFDALAYATTKYGPKAALDILNQFGRTWINPKLANEYIRGSKALVTRQGGELAIRESLEALRNTKATKSIRNLLPQLKQSKALDLADEGYRKFMTRGFKMLQEADVRTAAGVHKGLRKVLERHGVENIEQELDFLTNLVSGSSDVTMRPLVLSRGEYSKLWFTFQTFMLNRWSMIAHDMVSSGIINAGKQREKGITALTNAFKNPQELENNIKTSQYAIMSGERAGLSAKENAARTQELIRDLKQAGFKPMQVEGNYGGVAEKSFLVPGMTDQEALDLAQRYQQDSVLTPHGLLYGDGTMNPANTLGTVFDDAAVDNYTKIKVGDREVKFQIPVDFNARTPIDKSALSKPMQDPNVMKQKLRAIIGLGILGAGSIAEDQARRGIYQLTTGNEQQPQSVASQLVQTLPSQIPYFGNIISAVSRDSSALPPVLKTVENLFKGIKRMSSSDKESTRIKGALQAIQGGASLTLGIPGTSQLFDLLNHIVPDEHKKIKFKKSKQQKMIDRLRRA